MFLFRLLVMVFASIATKQQKLEHKEKDNSTFVDVFTVKDLHSMFTEPTLVFLYYNKPGFHCPICEEFKQRLGELKIAVKALNFADNVELGSRFLQHTFPAFIIRYEGKSYILNPLNTEQLNEIINTRSWMKTVPVRNIIDINSYFAIVFSKVNRVIFYAVTGFHYLTTIMPEYMISLFIICVILFLIYSIVDVLITTDPKQIKEKSE